MISFFQEPSTLLWHACMFYFSKQMSDEWAKCKKILEREDEEFKKAMEVEVITILFSKFSSKCTILVGVGIIA